LGGQTETVAAIITVKQQGADLGGYDPVTGWLHFQSGLAYTEDAAIVLPKERLSNQSGSASPRVASDRPFDGVDASVPFLRSIAVAPVDPLDAARCNRSSPLDSPGDFPTIRCRTL
jgi:hypothetical protein